MKLKKVAAVIGAVTGSIGAVILSANIFNKSVYKKAVKNDSAYEKGEFYDWTEGTIHYKVYGSGNSILLIHSLYIGASNREWDSVIDTLSEKYRVYAVDLPGYGYSDKPKITYTAFLYASFIKDFIDNIICGKTSIIASNGSAMFAVIAAKLFPDKIKSLFLISPAGIDEKMAENSNFKTRTLMEFPLKGTVEYNLKTSEKAIRNFLENTGFYAKEKVTEDMVKAFYCAAHSETGNARYAYASYITNYMNMDISQYITKLNIPLTVLWGEESEFNKNSIERLKTLVPWAKYYIFEKCRVFPHMENPNKFCEVIFINQN